MKPVHMQESALDFILGRERHTGRIGKNICGASWVPSWDISNFQINEHTKEIMQDPFGLVKNVKVTCPECIKILKQKGL